jgi:hypothetical protein
LSFDRSRLLNLLVNIVAVALVVAVIYYLVVPVVGFFWSASVAAAADGYRRAVEFVTYFARWDRAPFLLLGIAVYLAPAILAFKKGHPNRRGIFLLNLLTGWSVIGWALALVWSLSGKGASAGE